MAILTRTGSLLFAGAAALAALGLGAGTTLAAAAPTFTIKPGGSFTANSTSTTLTDTTTATALSCTSSKVKGTLKSGTGLAGAGAGSVSSLSFSGCTGPLGLSFTVKAGHLPWTLNLSSFKSGVTKGTITGIHATLSGPACSATVDGTKASGDNGKVDVTYTNSSGKLRVLTTGGNLHIYKVSGCAGLINSGDASTFSATYKLSPVQTITSP